MANAIHKNKSSEKANSKKIEIKSIHKDHRKRVKNKFLTYGLDTFTEIEVLETLLFYSIPFRDTNVIAHRLLDKFGSLKSVMEADYCELIKVEGISENSASLIVFFREMNIYINTNLYERINFSTSRIAGKFCCNYFKNHINENFIVISLDQNKNIKCINVISKGTSQQTALYLDSVLKSALHSNSSLIVLAHNHPGAEAEPSVNDIMLTDMLAKSLSEVGITVMDHIVCNESEFVSMSDRGMLKY